MEERIIIKRGLVYLYKAKEDLELLGESKIVYRFKKSHLYSAKILNFGFSKIGIDKTRVLINTKWLLDNFEATGERWSKEKDKECE